jgi:hypothetical protein
MPIGESIENLLMNIVVKKRKTSEKTESQKDAFPYLFTWKRVQ